MSAASRSFVARPAAASTGKRWLVVGACIALALPMLSCRQNAAAPRAALSPPAPEQFDDTLKHACWSEPGSWPQFCHDPLHTGRVDVDFASPELKPAWQFRPTGHVYQYQSGMSVWSTPVAGTVGGRPLVIAGYCDRNLYAIDGATGEKAWEFGPGAHVFSSPALATVGERALVIVAATNRTIYAVDAATGDRQWACETATWSFTQPPSVMSSPVVIDLDGEPLVVVGVWNSDRSAVQNLQSGELLALRAADGHPRWRRRLASVPITSPVFCRMGEVGVVFVASHHGVVYAVRAADGEVLWESTLNEASRSSVSLAHAEGVAALLVGTRQHSLFALDPSTGSRRWRAPAHYWIDATPTWFATGKTTTVVAGSYDRSVYAWRADDGRQLWTTPTGNYAYATPAIAALNGELIVFQMSWDQGLYMLDGKTGRELWKVRSGPLLWSHALQGDSLWASPIVARLSGRPMVLFPACDGVMYAYTQP